MGLLRNPQKLGKFKLHVNAVQLLKTTRRVESRRSLFTYRILMPDGLSNNVKNLVLEKHGVLKDAPNRTTEGVNEK